MSGKSVVWVAGRNSADFAVTLGQTKPACGQTALESRQVFHIRAALLPLRRTRRLALSQARIAYPFQMH